MDVVDIGAALNLAKKGILPAATSTDAGEVLTVGADGSWTKGAITGAVMSISGTTLVIEGSDS